MSRPGFFKAPRKGENFELRADCMWGTPRTWTNMQ